MECKALRTFNSSRFGYIRTGARFSCDDKGHAHELRRNGLIEILPNPPGPDRFEAIKRAPQEKGQPLEPPPAVGEKNLPVEDAPADGQARRSLLSRVVRPSTRKTARSSKGEHDA